MKLAISQFSPAADGITRDTQKFQHALDLISAHGGGTLYVDSGRYMLGGLLLGSNTCLHLEAGAELIVSDNYQDFAQARTHSSAECSDRAFLYALNAQNITISGSGKIFGSADAYFSATPNEQGYRIPLEQRPRIIVFEGCQNVQLREFTIEHAPMWTIHLVSCNNIKISELTVQNDLTMANTDALDIDSCQLVHITNSLFSAADDAICLKTTRKPEFLQQPARQIVISNCTLQSKSCALKIGTETFADIEDVSVSNCAIYQSNRGIGIISRDGGHLRRMQFSHITFTCQTAHPCHWGKADPLFVSVRHRDPAITPGKIEWISFSHFTGISEGAINLHSTPAGMVNHIRIDHLQLEQRQTDSPEQGLYDVRPPCNPLRPTGMGLDNAYCLDPDTQRAFGVESYPHGMPVIYAVGVKDLTLEQLSVQRPVPLPEGWNSEYIELVEG